MTKKVLTPYAARLESKSTGAWEAINYDDCDQMAAGHDARLQVFSFETIKEEILHRFHRGSSTRG